MEYCFTASTEAGFVRTILIGSDLPQLTPERVQCAFEALRKYPVVIGPDAGGGLYLIGYQKPLGILASGIEWSQGTDCETLQAKCRERKIEYHLLPVEQDFDTTDDVQKWHQAHLASPLPIQKEVRGHLAASYPTLEKIALVQDRF